MEETVRKELFLLQNNVRHVPFALTNEKLYFVGFEDFVPDRIGVHLKGSMMGLWFPPYRLLESMWFERDGKILQSQDLRLSSTSRLFSFEGFEVEISAPESSTVFLLKIRRTGKECAEVNVHMKCSVIPVWGYEPEYDWKLLDTGKFPAVEINKGELIYLISNTGNGTMSVMEDEVVLHADGNDTILIKKVVNSFDELKVDREQQVENLSESYSNLATADADLNIAFSWSKTNIKWLYSDYGPGRRGITAGQPEFPWFYSIDTFVSLEGMLAAGFFKVASNSLYTLFDLADRHKGVVPHEVISTGDVYESGFLMETAFTPTALWKYYNWTGDTWFLKRHFYTAVRGYEILLKRGLEGKYTIEAPEKRKGIDIGNICYFINGATDLLRINALIHGGIANDFKNRLSTERDNWIEFLNNEMWMNDEKTYGALYLDGVPVLYEPWKTIFPFEQKLVPEGYRYTEYVNSHYFRDITTTEGLRGSENGYIKPVNTGLLVKAALNHNDTETAWDFYSRNLASFGKYSTACFPELTDDSRGCFLQAWSSSLIIENMVEGFLGVSASKGKLKVEPQLPKELKFSKVDLKNIRAGKRKYNISFLTDSFIGEGYKIEEITNTGRIY